MRIAIIGYGNVGRVLGLGWAAAGHEVIFGVRALDKPEVKAFREANPGAGVASIGEAVAASELVCLATPYDAALSFAETAGDLNGKILLDCTNPIGAGLKLVVGHDTSGAEEIAKRAQGAVVVKSFNTTGWENMERADYPGYGGLRPLMPVCGDDAEANARVCALAEDLGFEPWAWGPLEGARFLEPMAMVWIIPGRVQGLGPDFAFALLRR